MARTAGSGRQALTGGNEQQAAEEHRIPSDGSPVLIGCAHGTRDREGRDAIRAIMSRVRATHPRLAVREAYVDVQEPAIEDVVREVAGTIDAVRTREAESIDAVVVPLLLSTGFHVGQDIARAVRSHRAAAAGPLGPDPRLATVMADRLREA